ncbi:MAG: hypothetical protein ABSF14_17630, partial [Terriglobia bacterium]
AGIHRRRGGSPPPAAPERTTKARNCPGTRFMIGTENGGRSAHPNMYMKTKYIVKYSNMFMKINEIAIFTWHLK